MRKISFKGIVIGSVVDIVGSSAWAIILGVYMSIKYNLYALSQGEQASQLYELLNHSLIIHILNIIIGGGFTILGGYIAAKISKHNELLNATLSSLLSLILFLPMIKLYPVIDAFVINMGLGYIGGFLRLKYMKI